MARSFFISAKSLSDIVSHQPPFLFDCSWHMPATGRKGREEWIKKRIPRSLFFDIDDICDHSTSLPHMLPTVSEFWPRINQFGITNRNCPIVLYDSSSLYVASARVFWMLRVFGFEQVQILQGGLRSWEEEGLPTSTDANENGTTTLLKEESDNVFLDHLVYTCDKMKKAVADPHPPPIFDARSYDRFHGLQNEPRSGLRSGHIPKTLNLPYTELFPPSGGHFLSIDELNQKFKSFGLPEPNSEEARMIPIVTTCGSGVTASVVALALNWCGYLNVAVYDGSFSEWGQEKNGLRVIGKDGKDV
jgi:thiosulfate/3-mercaptopyruvate sulfurtransferase